MPGAPPRRPRPTTNTTTGTPQTMAADTESRRPTRWHIGVFLAPAVLVYTAVMIVPLYGTLQLSLFKVVDQQSVFVGLDNFRTLFGDPRWSASFWNALGNNFWFFVIHMLVQNPDWRAAGRVAVEPETALPGLLPHHDLRSDDPVLRDRRLHLEADPVAALGRGSPPPRPDRAEEPVRAVARQGRVCAHRAQPGIGVAIRRHTDDADICRAAVDTRRGDRGRRVRRHHRHGAILENQAAPDPAGDRHHLDPDLRRQLQRV